MKKIAAIFVMADYNGCVLTVDLSSFVDTREAEDRKEHTPK